MEKVDRTQSVLTDGTPITKDHREIISGGIRDGQQKGYAVLTEEERRKGFIRPVRQEYSHLGKLTEIVGVDGVIVVLTKRMGGCEVHTIMGLALAETYARDPQFYTGTFCVGCKEHLPLNEFVWKGTEEQVGS